MTTAPAGTARRRWAAALLTLVLLAIAVVIAVVIAGRADSPPPSAGPAVTSPEPATTSPSPAAPATVPAAESPEPVQPPVVVPPIPQPQPGPEPEPVTPQPSAPFPPSLRGQDLTVLPGAGNVVALTFDAGADAEGLPKILSTLSAKGVPATFFLTGTWAASNPGGVGQIAAAGHRIANHSLTHPGFTGLSDPLIADQVRGAEQTIQAAGADPRPFFRFPFGERDARTIAAVNDLGYVPVRWTVDTLGWKGTSGGISTQTVTDRVLGGLQPGEIVLMHAGSNPDDGSTLDADALAQVIDRISSAGYGFVTLDQLVGG
ncbi:polysaccharide deacetylase family protein [Arthrobacter sp. L77]|uniref:polysaccharide deacetylase family protein n=1 Tax=Arthrobacter sp. L77 TaxID=1496689 RepID=UPI0005BD1BF7|nr:polysaccharide deacetylase family protein [Arthrobacter sp. L77]